MRSLHLTCLLPIAFLLFGGSSFIVADETFYIGTDSATNEGIYVGSLDPETGKLGVLRLAIAAKNPNFLALSPDAKFLYAAIGTRNSCAVNAFAVQPDNSLTLLNAMPSGGEGTCHISVDKSGRDVFLANFNAGNIACFSTKQDGSLDQRTALMTLTGSGPNLKRQKKAYAHSVYTDPENKHLYSCDLGSDRIWTFKFDPGDGSLVPSDPPAAKVPPGSGPRHLAFSTDGQFVYVVNEIANAVEMFSRDVATGQLTSVQSASTLTAGTSGEGVTAAEVVCHPSGKWLYVSNRGSETLAVFMIGVDGKLSLAQSVPSVVTSPRSFTIDPSGKWLVAAGQKDNRIGVFKVDQASGQLSPTDQFANVGVPVCVLFVAKKP